MHKLIKFRVLFWVGARLYLDRVWARLIGRYLLLAKFLELLIILLAPINLEFIGVSKERLDKIGFKFFKNLKIWKKYFTGIMS